MYLLLVTPFNINNGLWEKQIYRKTSSPNKAFLHGEDASWISPSLVSWFPRSRESVLRTIYVFSQAPRRFSLSGELSFATICTQERGGGIERLGRQARRGKGARRGTKRREGSLRFPGLFQ